DAAHRAAVLQVKAMLRAHRLRHPAAQRSAEPRQGVGHLVEAVLVDLVGLQPDCLQTLIAERVAVKEESDSAGARCSVLALRSRRQEVDAHEPAVLHLKAAFLERFAPARIPGRLSAALDLSTWDRPTLLVIRFED